MLVKRVCHSWVLTCVLIAGALAAIGAAPAADAAKPWVVKIHADWCPTCVRLMPTWERIEAELDPDTARPVKVLKGETELRAYEQAITAAASG